MKVLICDDEPIFINYIKERISEYNVEIVSYSDSQNIISNDGIFDIAFVDIEMKPITGFTVARHIHNINKDCILVFFTNHFEFAAKGYEFNAFRYIYKKEPEPVINRQIRATFFEYHKRNKKFNIAFKGNTCSIFIKDIIYIEVLGRIAVIHTTKSDYQCYKKLNDIQEEFKQYGFSRCHKSYFVNLSHVKSVNRNDVIFYNNESAPIGRNYKSDFENNYVNFEVSGEI